MANRKSTNDIVWPEGHFTINDVQEKHPDVVNITLRFRVNSALAKKELSVIGKLKPTMGRPKKVFVKGTPTKELLEAAQKAGVILEAEQSVKIPVVDVKADDKSIGGSPANVKSSITEKVTA